VHERAQEAIGVLELPLPRGAVGGACRDGGGCGVATIAARMRRYREVGDVLQQWHLAGRQAGR